MIFLYTLPNCPICTMVKAKLQQKGLEYEERDFAEVAGQGGIDYAPYMAVMEGLTTRYFYSPTEIVEWINSQEG